MAKTKTTIDPLSAFRGATTPDADAYEVLKAYIEQAKNRKDLLKALQDIAPAARELPIEDRDQLREHAASLLQTFNTRVPSNELENRVVEITKRPRYLETKFGATFLLSGKFIGDPKDGQEFEAWLPGSEGGQTYRFFARRNRPDDWPAKVIFTRIPHEFTNKQGKLEQGSMWQVQLVPEASAGFQEVPF